MGFLSWVANAFGFTRKGVTQEIAAMAEPSLYLQHTRIGGNLTPDAVSQIMLLADQGWMWQLVDLADESRQRDCHLQAILGSREMAISGLPWQIVPASKTKRDKKVADFCTDFLTNLGLDDPSPEPRDLANLASHLAGGNYYGHAVAENFFAKDGAQIRPVACAPVMPRRFVYDQADGKLRFWDRAGIVPYPGIDLQNEFPGRFIQFQPRVNGGGHAREGLMRALLWAALFRNWGMRDWMQLAELAWKPWRIGTYTREANGTDKAALLRALQYLTSTGIAMLPETANFKAEWTKGAGGKGESQHAALCAFMAAEMSKAVLGATLTVEQGRVGSNALGNVHNDVRHDIRDADARAIASVIRRHLIAVAVWMNYGRDTLVPGFNFVTDDQVDVEGFSRAIANLRMAGLRIPAAYVRATAGIPEPKGDEELLAAPAPIAEAPKPPSSDGSGETQDDQKIAA